MLAEKFNWTKNDILGMTLRDVRIYSSDWKTLIEDQKTKEHSFVDDRDISRMFPIIAKRYRDRIAERNRPIVEGIVNRVKGT